MGNLNEKVKGRIDELEIAIEVLDRQLEEKQELRDELDRQLEALKEVDSALDDETEAAHKFIKQAFDNG